MFAQILGEEANDPVFFEVPIDDVDAFEELLEGYYGQEGPFASQLPPLLHQLL